MCGRYTNTVGPEELNERFGVPMLGEQGTRRFNIAPSEQVLAIVAPEGVSGNWACVHGERATKRSKDAGSRNTGGISATEDAGARRVGRRQLRADDFQTRSEGRPEARMLRWGLIPHWAKDMRVGNRMINARMETVASSNAFGPLIANGSRRALQIADGYYEWLKAERRGQPPAPILFRVDGGVPFAFAALWTPARVEGRHVESIVLLTCDASSNRVAAAVHERMPVILADREAQRAWLDHRLDAHDALTLCGPLPEQRLSASPANPAVNKAGVEGPELIVAPE